jgi:hypothetical protein
MWWSQENKSFVYCPSVLALMLVYARLARQNPLFLANIYMAMV